MGILAASAELRGLQVPVFLSGSARIERHVWAVLDAETVWRHSRAGKGK